MESITYTHRPDGIYHLVVHEANREACDGIVELHKKWMQQHDKNEPFRLLVDTRPGGVPPVRYLFGEIKNMYKDMHDIPQIIAVYIYRDGAMLAFVQSFLNLLRLQAHRQFLQHYDGVDGDAIAWLLSQE